ncbi:MAG: SUMF1/EgtB/PvdO family nonheme iron enzyme, partial [Peptostreptococcales bacterium]
MFKFIRRALSLILTLTIALSLIVITPMIARAAMPTAYPSTTTFVMNGQTVSVPEAYSINGSNYLQLRGIAALLKGTAAQFDVYWDRAIVIEPGKPYTGTTTPTKLAETTDVRYNKDASFIIAGYSDYDRLQDAYYIDGDTNYVQLRYFAGLLNGTASQFNVYWDSLKGQAVIEPGAYYTGVNPNYVGSAPSIDMVHVPAGAYDIYGTKVTLTKGYNIGTYEVTQEQYQSVMGKNPSYFDGSDDNWVGNVLTQMPDGSYIYMFDLVKSSDGAPKGTVPGEVQARRAVDSVSWYDALVFCNKLSMLSNFTPVYSINGSTNPKDWGIVPTSNNDAWNAVAANWDANGYRLPTSAEWYIASRAGTDKLFYGKEDDITSFDLLVKMRDDYAWYVHNSSVPLSNTELGYTHEVGKRLPNPWGLYDMYGNVNEWCWDFDSNTFPYGVVDPIGPTADVTSNTSRRTYSGGSSHTD